MIGRMFRRVPETSERLDLLEERIRRDLYGERPRTLGRCAVCGSVVRSNDDVLRLDGTVMHGRCAPSDEG